MEISLHDRLTPQIQTKGYIKHTKTKAWIEMVKSKNRP